MTPRYWPLRSVFQASWFACSLVIVAQSSGCVEAWPVVEACRIDPERPDGIRLDACRPAPVSAATKALFIGSLPAKGEVKTLGKRDREKLDAVRAVLRLEQRDQIYDVKVIDVPSAWTGLYGRAILLISLPTLKMLTDDEVAAVAAHEIGHEYVWDAYEQAKLRKDRRTLRQLELVCDAIAAKILLQAGITPERLARALETMEIYNSEHFGIARDQDAYPSLRQRRRILLGMAREPRKRREAK